MIFQKDRLAFNILDVIEIKQGSVNMNNGRRSFSALSFRTRSDTVLRTATCEKHLTDNFIAYVPARLDYARISEYDELIVIHFDTVDDSSNDIECFEAKQPEEIGRLFRQMLTEWQEKRAGYRLRCSAMLYEILAECYCQNLATESKGSKIQDSVDYIHSNYKRSDLTVGEVAERSFISEVYFRRLFKAEYGMSPQKYIVDLRIREAASLILTGYYSLKEIAYMSGYSDYKYFSVEFKRIIGVSPSEYSYKF